MLTRNSLCPCKSGRKVKRCHNDLLAKKANVQQNLFHLDQSWRENNRRALAGEKDFKEMELMEYKAHLTSALKLLDAL